VTFPVFRFAPSPNGRLHLGHAYSALLNAEWARRARGRFLLRIEDIDLARCRPEFEALLYEDLSWLGLSWERPVRRQSEHFEDYLTAFLRLKARGLAYPCFCSRSEVASAVARREALAGTALPRDPDGAPLYPGTCRHLPEAAAAERIGRGEPHAWRLHMSRALAAHTGPGHYTRVGLDGRETLVPTRPESWGDAVIVRKDVPTSYHLSVVVDDDLQGVTHVVRGADLEAATDLHVLLQGLMGLATPLYHHHRLVLDPAGEKLAKSVGSTALADLRAQGATPSDIRRRLGFADPEGPGP
jgi:glutamyl-Q tRNA(Asp) synthetase